MAVNNNMATPSKYYIMVSLTSYFSTCFLGNNKARCIVQLINYFII